MKESRTVRLIAALLFVDFLALNLYALYSEGAGALLEMLEQGGPWIWVLTADLLIALGLVCGYIWHEARARDTNPLAYILLTPLTGSIAPLLYLMRAPKDAP